MADPKDPLRLLILKGMTAALAEITPAAGYQHDLSPTPEYPQGRVFRGRTVFGDSDPIPMVSILETPIPPDQVKMPNNSPLVTGLWELELQGWVEDDRQNPTDPAYRLCADVKMRLAKANVEGMDGGVFGIKRCDRLEIGPGIVRPPDMTSDKANFWLTIRVFVTEDASDPYRV